MSGELGALSALEAWFQSFTCGSMCSQDKVEDGKDYSFTLHARSAADRDRNRPADFGASWRREKRQ